jgi:D-3-phosphoglycerate dehydrogenase
MIKIQTLNKIAAIGTDNFDKSKYVVSDSVENPDAILVRSASMHEMQFGSNLLAIARAGAGVNNIPIDKCSEAGICVFNTPGANANAVKELVIAGLLLSSRKIPQAMDWVKTLKGKGDEVPKLVEKGKGDFAGPEIMGKALGVIGLGAIGVLVANAAISLGMKVMGYDPFLSLKAAWGLSPAVIYSKTLKEIYENCDYITVHVPYNGDTKEMLCAEAFASMKSGVRILNFARGELVNDADMLSALESGKVAAYVTDFPNDALIGAKNVVTIPHLGASTPESEDNCAYMAAVQLIDYIENGNIKNSVNLPDAEMSASGTKVCIIHKNIPTLISQITAALGSEKINIENMLNKSKKEYAYTMIDASGAISEKVISMLNSIEGVIKVRVI